MKERAGNNPILESDNLEFKQSHISSTGSPSGNLASLGTTHKYARLATAMDPGQCINKLLEVSWTSEIIARTG